MASKILAVGEADGQNSQKRDLDVRNENLSERNLDPNALSSYDYLLPPDLIASKPVIPKEDARLLVYRRRTGEIEHLKFGNLLDVLPQDAALIFNDTKVIKARIFGHKQSGGAVELLINQPLGDGVFSCYVKGRVSAGAKLKFKGGVEGEILRVDNDGIRLVKFSKLGSKLDTVALFNELDAIGHVPLPPYIKRADNEQDVTWYQSVFAKNKGAVAAPTASLHFSEAMMERIRRERESACLTLHVGAGTFKGVEVSDIREHKMHAEFYDVSKPAQELIKSGVKILGVGTTVTRCVEEFARSGRASGACSLFLNPSNPPVRQDYLLTNFHLPKSTLIMLVASFVGLRATHKIYETAVRERYRFYSYGDAMLVL